MRIGARMLFRLRPRPVTGSFERNSDEGLPTHTSGSQAARFRSPACGRRPFYGSGQQVPSLTLTPNRMPVPGRLRVRVLGPALGLGFSVTSDLQSSVNPRLQ